MTGCQRCGTSSRRQGCARGEALGIRGCDLILEDGSLSIVQTVTEVAYEVRFSTPKTERSRRRISLDPETVAALRSHRARQATERLASGQLYALNLDLMFADEFGGPLHPQHVTPANGSASSERQVAAVVAQCCQPGATM